MKAILRLIAYLFSVVGLVATIILFIPNTLAQEVTIIIPPRTSTISVANILLENRLIRCPRLFALYSKVSSFREGPLLSGEYKIPPHSNIIIIASLLRRGSNVLHKITIPEGMHVRDIIELVNMHPNLQGNKIANNLSEGSLSPNTYHFQYGETKQDIINTMHKQMLDIEANIIEHLPNLSAKYPMMKTVDDVINLASIVELEAKLDNERPLIAAVFLNRLKYNMPLQADPTVVYAVEMNSNKRVETISKADLKFESPYNTYLHTGLPPGPIACPGTKAINAVLHPADVKYLYFVSDNKGGHNFSSDLTAHNQNVIEFRKNNR